MEMFIRPNSITAPSSPVHYSVPSTPDPYGGDQYYISAPSSPSQLSHFYRDFNDLLLSPSDQRKSAGNHEAEFAFDVNVNDDFSNHSVSSADELFHGGVIKPMQIPSREHRSTVSKGKDFLAGALSPRNKKDSTSLMREKSRNKDKRSPEHDRRGRERIPLISSSSRRSAARSLSPVRVSQYPWEEERHQHHQHQHQEQQQSSANTKPTTSSSISNNKSSQLSNSGSKGLRKWRLKDFFLFRSASEGRSYNKDPLRKYTFAFRKCEEVKGSSSKINVAESPGSGSGSVSKRKGKVSAHELHYTANRAVSEDLKKKTFLPYKQGILGRLAINPAVHGVGNGFGFTKK